MDVVNASGATDVEINAVVLTVPGVGIAPKVIGIPEVEAGTGDFCLCFRHYKY